MNKRIKALTALLLSLLLLLPMSNTVVLAEEQPDSIFPSLQDKLKNSNGPFPVFVMSTVSDEMSRELLRQEWDEASFAEYAAEFQQEVGLKESETALDMRYLYEMTPLGLTKVDGSYAFAFAAVWLDKEEILRVASHERVDVVMDITSDRSRSVPIHPISYTAFEALRMLQISVGLFSGVPYARLEDVNLDGNINAVDALLALQESVGLVCIAEPMYIKAMREGNLEFWTDGYDWEIERMPKKFSSVPMTKTAMALRMATISC